MPSARVTARFASLLAAMVAGAALLAAVRGDGAMTAVAGILLAGLAGLLRWPMSPVAAAADTVTPVSVKPTPLPRGVRGSAHSSVSWPPRTA
jgi:hypothetical protein